MSISRTGDPRYANFWLDLAKFLREDSGFPVSDIARTSSRRRCFFFNFLDIIFRISGDPPKEQVYPALLEKIQERMEVKATIGGNNNDIHIEHRTLNFDLILLAEHAFREEVEKFNLQIM